MGRDGDLRRCTEAMRFWWRRFCHCFVDGGMEPESDPSSCATPKAAVMKAIVAICRTVEQGIIVVRERRRKHVSCWKLETICEQIADSFWQYDQLEA